jgi:hypothetical protein
MQCLDDLKIHRGSCGRPREATVGPGPPPGQSMTMLFCDEDDVAQGISRPRSALLTASDLVCT